MSKQIDDWINYYSKEGDLVLLESQSSDHPESCTCYLAAEPISSIKAYGETIVIEEGGERNEFVSNPWEALSNYYSDKQQWLFGYLGYDLKNSIEVLQSENPDPVQAPDLYFIVPGTLIKIDRRSDSFEVLRGDVSDMPIHHSLSKKEPDFRCGELQFSVDKEQYLKCIAEAQHRIKDGEFYEINLTHQLSADFAGRPYELYQQMRQIGPVPFGAYAEVAGLSICSMSPERFLKKRGDRVISQPIKGTIKRGATAREDQLLRKKLKASIKDRAENLMIVDLVRNDLGRIASKGSVEVSRLFEIQTFGTVHQMVSTIQAMAAVDDPIEIIKACYPMGSMTGAPKISAMKSIEELENYRRGIYSGAMGYLDPEGNFDFNVVIRTAILSAKELYYSVGGAITGDSNPEEEWEETLVKARALTGLHAESMK